MKKLLFSIAIGLTGLMTAQVTEFGKVQVTQVSEAKTDFAEITYEPTYFFWRVYIKNTTGENITVDWDKTTFVVGDRSGGVVFEETIKMMMDQPKGTEVVAPNATLYKKIYPRTHAEYMDPIISKKRLNDVTINLNIEGKNIPKVFKMTQKVHK